MEGTRILAVVAGPAVPVQAGPPQGPPIPILTSQDRPEDTTPQARQARKALTLGAVQLRYTLILPLIIMHFIPLPWPPLQAAWALPPPLPPPTCRRA